MNRKDQIQLTEARLKTAQGKLRKMTNLVGDESANQSVLQLSISTLSKDIERYKSALDTEYQVQKMTGD